MTLNYADPDDALVEVTCFDNPNHIQLPSVVPANIDSATYNKKDRSPPPPPPVTDNNK